MSQTISKITDLAFNLHRLMKRKVIEEANFSGDVSLLHLEVICLIGSNDNLTMKQLAEALHISAPSATSLVNRLVKAGLVARKTDKNNRKLVLLEATAKGKKAHDINKAKSREVVGDILSILSKGDQKDMLRIYEKLVGSLTT